MGEESKADVAKAQEAIFKSPTYLIDGNLGIATAFGVARITFGAFKLNAQPDAEMPVLHPVVTIAVPEKALLQFANEVIERAQLAGITLESDSQ